MKYFACCFVPGGSAHHVLIEGERKPICGTKTSRLVKPDEPDDFDDALLSMRNCPSACRKCKQIVEKKEKGVAMKKRSGKVIHISDSLHKTVKRFCESRGLTVSQWVEGALEISMQAYKEAEKEERQ